MLTALCSRINQSIAASYFLCGHDVLHSFQAKSRNPMLYNIQDTPQVFSVIYGYGPLLPFPPKVIRLISQTGLAAGLQQSNSVAFWITRATNPRFDSTVRETKQTARVSAHLPGNHGVEKFRDFQLVLMVSEPLPPAETLICSTVTYHHPLDMELAFSSQLVRRRTPNR